MVDDAVDMSSVRKRSIFCDDEGCALALQHLVHSSAICGKKHNKKQQVRRESQISPESPVRLFRQYYNPPPPRLLFFWLLMGSNGGVL